MLLFFRLCVVVYPTLKCPNLGRDRIDSAVSDALPWDTKAARSPEFGHGTPMTKR